MNSMNILEESNEIVNGERAESYGCAVEGFRRAGEIFAQITNDDDSNSIQVVKALISTKLSREAHKHGRDNLVDLCGYAEILNKIHENEKL